MCGWLRYSRCMNIVRDVQIRVNGMEAIRNAFGYNVFDQKAYAFWNITEFVVFRWIACCCRPLWGENFAIRTLFYPLIR